MVIALKSLSGASIVALLIEPLLTMPGSLPECLVTPPAALLLKMIPAEAPGEAAQGSVSPHHGEGPGERLQL